MHPQTTIQSLDAAETIFVLRDESGREIGTGARETLEVVTFILRRATSDEEPRFVARPDRQAPYKADVRSALSF
jgi:hypothetical protein